MYAVDFEYDGYLLSNYNFILCTFDSNGGVNNVSAGSNLTFNKVSHNTGKRYSLTSTQYDECITSSFDICKNPCDYEQLEMEISDYEFRRIMRWLNRKEFLKFKPIYSNSDRYCFYNASFNVSKIMINGILYGIHLEMETDKPFGFGTEKVFPLTFDENNIEKNIIDESDEIGYIYPKVEIVCKQDGDIFIQNSTENCTTVIKNCTVGEVITLSGDTQIISTSLNSHDICNDFNYDFFKIGNTINNRNNLISVSAPCDITIKYNPIIKNSPLI